MSLRFWLTDRITVERNTPTKSAGGAAVPSWAAISATTTNMRALVYKHSDKPQHPVSEFSRRDWKGDFSVVTDVACGAKPGDRVNHGGVYYDILDTFNYGHPRIASSAVYVMDCLLRRVASGAS